MLFYDHFLGSHRTAKLFIFFGLITKNQVLKINWFDGALLFLPNARP